MAKWQIAEVGDRGQGGQLISYQLSVIKLNWSLLTVN
ncbi:hypothetical protein NIES4106_06830 [Fischerella sp. NIES-4106]|nr:hypothetical protein NIES4106_06830 [Fischerella sp. NIES-4106]